MDSIVSDSMMTVAAVDRLVHHALIIEIKAESDRKQAATNRSKTKTVSFSLQESPRNRVERSFLSRNMEHRNKFFHQG